MYKIGIITIQSRNFGNRLQNFALQEVLHALGHTVFTIRREMPTRKSVGRRIQAFIQFVFQTKNAKFEKFDKRIFKSKEWATADEWSKNIRDAYDFFIAGSDQLWNPYYNFVGGSDFLTFAKRNQKISYAASFGVSEIPKEQQGKYRSYLSTFKEISVREERASEIVYNLTGELVEVVLDPTFLIKRETWKSIERKPRGFYLDRYVLVYELGEADVSLKTCLTKIREKGKLDIVDIRKKTRMGKEWSIGPMEFLYLIDHAEYILTNSFHACVFSVIFHKRFLVFERFDLDMGSRIDTLLKNFSLENCRYVENYDVQNVEIDYEQVEKKLRVAQEKSWSFLKRALSEKE